MKSINKNTMRLKRRMAAAVLGMSLMMNNNVCYAKYNFGDKYDTFDAIIYAETYTYDSVTKKCPDEDEMYNKKFALVDKENDCTNFVSQCALAAGMHKVSPGNLKTSGQNIKKSMKYWYSFKYSGGDYSVSTSFIRTDNYGFFEHMTNYETRDIPYNIGLTLEQVRKYAKIGDVIQVEKNGDSVHSVIVTDKKGGEVYCTSHTDNYFNKEMAEINKSALEQRVNKDTKITYKLIKMHMYK